MTALWVHEMAERFWADAGGAPTGFPRDLAPAITWAVPVAVIPLPRLRITTVDAWLARHQVEARIRLPDRPLRACILAHDENGLLFVDADDPADERRFSLAHELAHYLAEYAAPRERAADRLGPSVLPVLDGRRAPSYQERAGALLAGVRLGPRLHLMERTTDGHHPGQVVTAAERRADELAFELIAPAETVRARLPAGATPGAAAALLRDTFGLPPAPAAAYARTLVPRRPAGSLFQQLFSGPSA